MEAASHRGRCLGCGAVGFEELPVAAAGLVMGVLYSVRRIVYELMELAMDYMNSQISGIASRHLLEFSRRQSYEAPPDVDTANQVTLNANLELLVL